MRAALSTEATYSIRITTWQALFAVLGFPPGVTRATGSHAAIVAALTASDLSDALARAINLVAASGVDRESADLRRGREGQGGGRRRARRCISP
jgi:hypothetical protein